MRDKASKKSKIPPVIPTSASDSEDSSGVNRVEFTARELYQMGFSDGVMRMSLAILLTVLVGTILRRVLPQ